MCPPETERDRADEVEDANADEADARGASPDALDLDALKRRGDVPGLLALARAHRAGTAAPPPGGAGGRDMKKCLEAYRAAAELGSAEAEYAVALFYLNGGIVAQDLKEGAMHLRAAAEKGSVPAKVYLGNLYELGIHYKADPEKADVWYRNAARAAGVKEEAGTSEHTRALAELGCARHVLELTAGDEGLEESERARLLARAKAHGHGLKIRDDDALGAGGDRATFVDALAGAEATATPPPVTVSVGAADEGGGSREAREAREARERKNTAPETKRAKEEAASKATPRASAERATSNVAHGLAAFGYALLFAVAGVGAGYAATLGAQELVARGQALPVFGTNTRLVFPAVLALVGVLPAWLVYRFGAWLKALVAAAGFGGIGWVAWGTGKAVLHSDRSLQALAFALAGFLATLLALGLLGGTKAAAKSLRARARARG